MTNRMEQVIGIRVDANGTVAMGHIMRCITIAKQMKYLRQKTIFFTADSYAHDLLEAAGMEYVCLNTAWNRMEDETQQLREELEKTGCRKLLVDSYQVTRAYFDKLRDICKIIYIDDCFEDVYPVDMVINYNAYHVRFPYKETYEGRAKLLLGTAYVPLREEFQRAYLQKMGMESKAEVSLCPFDFETKKVLHILKQRRDEQKGRVNVLLSSGGGDTYDALSGILQSAAEEPALSRAVFHVVVGKFNQNREKLQALAEKNPAIRLYRNVSNMAELMEECDLAVSAAGTVLFELCAMQIPAVFFVCADNQLYDSEFFADEERMLFAGDIRQDREECLKRINRNLKILLQDKALRKRMKEALCQVTDGQGALRIAEEIWKL